MFFNRSVVVIPTAHRPEFLALALEQLDQAVDAPDDIRIYLDTSTDERLSEVEWVRDTYLPRAEIFHAKSHIYAPSGTWNILTAIKSGYETGAEYIFLVEEDIMVRPNFFDWHFSQIDCLASCGRKDRRYYPIHGPLYTNPGSCLRRELVAKLIPHINDQYFTELRAYLDREFGVWDEQSHLDDGLIRRVIRQMGGKVVYPETPVCAHQGLRAYNMLDIYQNHGTIQERIAGLRKVISSIKVGDRYAFDFDLF